MSFLHGSRTCVRAHREREIEREKDIHTIDVRSQVRHFMLEASSTCTYKSGII